MIQWKKDRMKGQDKMVKDRIGYTDIKKNLIIMRSSPHVNPVTMDSLGGFKSGSLL